MIKWYLKLYQEDEISAGLLGGVMALFLPVTAGLVAVDLAIMGTKAIGSSISAASAAAKEDRRLKQGYAHELAIEREKTERERIAAMQVAARLEDARKQRCEEELRNRPPTREEAILAIHQEYVENVKIASLISDPATKQAISARAQARYLQRLARLIG